MEAVAEAGELVADGAKMMRIGVAANHRSTRRLEMDTELNNLTS